MTRFSRGTLTIFLVAGTGVALSCQPGQGDVEEPAGEPTWISERGEPLEQLAARQFRGLDVAMIEMDHRYAELYFAAEDGNWPYAEHQLEHMRLAMDLALERRPARARSARGNFYPALEPLEAAVAAEDPEAFARAYDGLRRACNTCHQAEGEPTLTVGIPTQRRTSIRPPST
jgi:hypothetical protein